MNFPKCRSKLKWLPPGWIAHWQKCTWIWKPWRSWKEAGGIYIGACSKTAIFTHSLRWKCHWLWFIDGVRGPHMEHPCSTSALKAMFNFCYIYCCGFGCSTTRRKITLLVIMVLWYGYYRGVLLKCYKYIINYNNVNTNKRRI